MSMFLDCGDTLLMLFCVGLSSLSEADLKDDRKGIDVSFSQQSLDLDINSPAQLKLLFSMPVQEPDLISFAYLAIGGTHIGRNHDNDMAIFPLPALRIMSGVTEVQVTVRGKTAGSLILGLVSNSSQFENLEDTYLPVSVLRSLPLNVFNAILGWTYAILWTMVMYPQLYLNWRRKSVVGLSLDFVTYNLSGFLAYMIYNIGMFAIPVIMTEYAAAHPRGVNPVQASDVAFTVHGCMLTVLAIAQCIFYDRGDQRVSVVCWVLTAGMLGFTVLTAVLAGAAVISWLAFVTLVSYIKLLVTVVKYNPQVWLNWKRKSTVGWSIWRVHLDLAGAVFSLLQMLLIAYNSDDWSSLFGDPTKFGLGLLSCFYSVIFIIQHYFLYADTIRSGNGYIRISC